MLGSQERASPGVGAMAQVVRDTCCSCRGPGFNSQHSCGGWQLSITIVPGEPDVLLSALKVLHTCTDVHRSKTPMHTERKSVSVSVRVYFSVMKNHETIKCSSLSDTSLPLSSRLL